MSNGNHDKQWHVYYLLWSISACITGPDIPRCDLSHHLPAPFR